MKTPSLIAVLVLLSLPVAASAVGSFRYRPPQSNAIKAEVKAEPGSPGTYTITGTFRAMAVPARKAVIEFRLPRSVDVIGQAPVHKGDVDPDKEIVLSVKVRLKAGAEGARVFFMASYDYPSDDLLRYIESHPDQYSEESLRNILESEIRSEAGNRSAVRRALVLGRRK
ncbi:MAG: hypothetical protein HY815_29635 [Candidatus Riflebacteria bacterium]|nr:hypothetical protein [Candidatus Riflebacteria bacterium]